MRESHDEATLPMALAAPDNTGASQRVPLDRIALVPQERKYAGNDDPRVVARAQSIAVNGQLHPILIRPRDEGDGYEVVCGECRYRACQRLGLTDIRAEIREMTALEARAVKLVENVDRSPLTYLEEAQAVHELLTLHEGNAGEVGRRIGLSDSAVRLRARLNDLSPAWRERLADPDSDHAHIGRNITWMEQIAILPQERQDELLDTGALLSVQTKRQIDGVIGQFMCSLEAAAKPWTREFERTHYSGSAKTPGKARCEVCSCRTDRIGILPGLEPDGKLAAACAATPHCLNWECYHAKAVAFHRYLLTKYREFCEAVLVWDGVPLPENRKRWAADYPGERILERGEFKHAADPDQAPPAGQVRVKAVVIGGQGSARREAVEVFIPAPAKNTSVKASKTRSEKATDASPPAEVERNNPGESGEAADLPAYSPPKKREMLTRLRELPPPVNPLTVMRAMLITGIPPVWASTAASCRVPEIDADVATVTDVLASMDLALMAALGWDMVREALEENGEATQMAEVLRLYGGNASATPEPAAEADGAP